MDRWRVIESGGNKHVVPIDDTQPHAMIRGCDCHPELHPETDSAVVVHNAFDCREMSEPNSAWGKPN